MASDTETIKEQQAKVQEKREIRHHIISFGMMVILTIFAFIAVATEGVSAKFIPIFILLLAVVQVVFQLFFFMHMKDKGHNFPAILMSGGVVVAILTVATLMSLIWFF